MKKGIGLLFVLTLIFSADINAQSKLEKDIVGLWKPAKIYDIGAVIPDASKQQIETIQKKLMDSKFHFRRDRNFSFESSFKDMNIKDGHWKVLSDNAEIIIQEWKDKDKERPVLMGISVLLKDGKTIFMLEETFFAFEMTKLAEDD